MGGSTPSKIKTVSSYQQLYSLARQVYHYQPRRPHRNHPPQSYDDLFALFKEYQLEYKWCQEIPRHIQNYFRKEIQTVRKTEIQILYRALKLTVFSHQSIIEDLNYEESFYSSLSSSEIKHEESNTVEDMLGKSILFEDDVITKCKEERGSRIGSSQNLFRESVIDPTLKKQESFGHCPVVMKEAIFVENLPVQEQKELAFYVEFYQRFATILESLLNSASFCSLPLRHFELNMKEKKARKKLKASTEVDTAEIGKLPTILQDSEEGNTLRQRRTHNQNRLLKEICLFICIYSDFVWTFYKLDKLEEVDCARLINPENIQNLITNAVWNRVQWVGDRGGQYEQFKARHYLLQKGSPPNSQAPPENVIQIASKMPNTPISYLKSVSLIYKEFLRNIKQATADVLILAYNRLFYELAVMNKMKGVYRMVHVVNALWKGVTFGQVGYAWITWQASLEMIINMAKQQPLQKLLKAPTAKCLEIDHLNNSK